MYICAMPDAYVRRLPGGTPWSPPGLWFKRSFGVDGDIHDVSHGRIGEAVMHGTDDAMLVRAAVRHLLARRLVRPDAGRFVLLGTGVPQPDRGRLIA